MIFAFVRLTLSFFAFTAPITIAASSSTPTPAAPTITAAPNTTTGASNATQGPLVTLCANKAYDACVDYSGASDQCYTIKTANTTSSVRVPSNVICLLFRGAGCDDKEEDGNSVFVYTNITDLAAEEYGFDKAAGSFLCKIL